MTEIQGKVEDIVFKNEDNGYVVAHIKDKKRKITITGCMPFILEGQNLKVQGEWVKHPHFGQQFKVTSCEEIVPNSLEGIEKYLSSGIISGIGPVTAKKIVEHFGEKTLEILDEDIERLKEIEGIGNKKVETIAKSYSKQREIRNIMVFLQTYGVTVKQCVKIHKKYGVNSIKVVKENPYTLTDDISGIGFKTADKIARSLGIESNSPFRIQCGIRYIVNQFCSMGNTYMPLEKLLKECKDMLMVSEDEILSSIQESVLNGKLKVEKIENEEAVFTMPYYYCELSVTSKILTLSISNYDNIKIDVESEIEKFEKDNNIKFAPTQIEAIKGAFTNGIEIITGGPGTGKTTIIKCITEIFENASMTVFMAAPTGRAAKRMSEATGREAKTIHRLLEMGFSDDEDTEFLRSEESPLQCDVLIIDEASMIDILLMNNLLKAISVGTRLIIVGDADQLPSVGPGNVLRDLIESKCVKVVRLKDIFRQAEESMIVVNAHKINNGEMPILNKKNKDFYFLNCEEQEKILDTLVELINERLPKFNKNWNSFKDIQILSPMRKGILGIENLNKRLQHILNPNDKNKSEKEFKDTIFRLGDKVMQTKNNYNLKWTRIDGDGEPEGLGVFNGDIGYICEVDEDKVSVIFDEERKVVYDNIYLDELELAYAMTVHKSQGSEFPVVIMPMFMGPPLLMNRNLFYTGITRAKQMVVLVGLRKAISFMISNNRSFERYSALKWRILNILEGDVVNHEDLFQGDEG
ncbi:MULTISPECIES: ATP-dependent RecD-like DNA helicase [Clostridium]|uniref:ATP-dependent RecD2 DNA helicase n=2 Tax=Clostridium TaxID=1485 RepID=A0A151AP12_9CLOT|nr:MULTISPECIES: ATP-dependent RecD-like DNA helicase [Clostridium]KYH29366.1 ATP-dependent RecD-like DNA helicase [Clostridium colicanis DSM 13634]MBE6043106.1 ATP-dependent RecD-like DNA helicase [Clostridium thermopalmarium]PRR70852.1 ATP-dependent RecD-like DNA helicase [Clostridium thermopalmarium DSM 5974]PVZ28776.1 exodeoxyribonuclease V alpha subunit [Clostridium thermopalmarium DSM 5974]